MRPSLKTFLWWCLGLSLFVLFTFHDLPSPDLWWQMMLGRLTLETRAIPRVDPFSFTAAGHPWIDDEWLAGILFYLLHSWGGLNLLHLFKSLFLAVIFALYVIAPVRSGRAALPWALAGGLTAMCFSEHAFFFDVRTYLFTYFFLGLTLLILELHHGGRRRALWALPPVILLWANFHAGFVAGLLVTGVYLCAALILRDRQSARALAVALGASLLVSLVNAHGVRTLLAPFELVSSPFRAHLNEWAPPQLFGRHAYVLCWIVLSWGALFLHRRAFRLHDAGLCLLFTAMAVSSWRHVPLFAFFSISLWAVALQAAGEAIFRHAAAIKPSPAMRNILLSAAALVFLGNSVVRLADPDLGSQSLEKKLFPCWTAQFLMANNLSPHLFHPYGWGGYLIWKIWPRYKVFIDGRAIDTYPAEVYRDYLRVSTGQAGAFDILNRRGISLALTFLPGGPEATSRIFEGNPQWRLIYEDDLSRVFIRTEELGARKLTYPANPHNLAGRAREAFTRGDFGAARAALERALGLDNRYAPAYLMLGAMELSRGDGPKGVSLTKRALELDPLIESAHYNLALYALRRDDRVLAMEELRKELGNNEGNTEARKLLLKLEAKR